LLWRINSGHAILTCGNLINHSTGFQLGHAPCEATSIHAFLDTKDSHLGRPPNASETVAEGSLAVSYTFR